MKYFEYPDIETDPRKPIIGLQGDQVGVSKVKDTGKGSSREEAQQQAAKKVQDNSFHFNGSSSSKTKTQKHKYKEQAAKKVTNSFLVL